MRDGDGDKGQSASDVVQLGLSLTREEKVEQALAAFEAALRLAPTHLGALAGKARSLAQMGRTQAALDAFTAASRLDPDDLEHLLQAGLCLLELGEVGQARVALRGACRLDGERLACAARVNEVGDSFLVRATRWRDRGVPKQEAVGYRLSEACFQIARELWPGSVEAARGLGASATGLGKHDEARRWAQLADALATVH